VNIIINVPNVRHFTPHTGRRHEPVAIVLLSEHKWDRSDRHQAVALSGPLCEWSAAIYTRQSYHCQSWQYQWCHVHSERSAHPTHTAHIRHTPIIRPQCLIHRVSFTQSNWIRSTNLVYFRYVCRLVIDIFVWTSWPAGSSDPYRLELASYTSAFDLHKSWTVQRCVEDLPVTITTWFQWECNVEECRHFELWTNTITWDIIF